MENNGELFYINFIVVNRIVLRSKHSGDTVFIVYTHTRLAIVRQLALETSATHRGHALTRLSLDAIMRIAHGFFALQHNAYGGFDNMFGTTETRQ